jgi:hypothetical protein
MSDDKTGRVGLVGVHPRKRRGDDEEAADGGKASEGRQAPEGVARKGDESGEP